MPWGDIAKRRGAAAPVAASGGWGGLAAARAAASTAADAAPETVAAPVADEGPDAGSRLGAAGLGAGALLLVGALLTRKPGMLAKAAKAIGAERMQLMLSGKAVPKSLLGNAGAAITSSIERGSTRPLREMFSGQTLREAAAAFKRGPAETTTTGGATNLPKWLSLPGRVMGAADEAAQSALQRAGLTAEESATEVLQTPLGKNFGSLGSLMENPTVGYLVPFRRTPFNQVAEAFRLAQKAHAGDRGAQRLAAASVGTGVAHGAATSDEQIPGSVPFAAAAAGKAGIPYLVGAYLGRHYLGGTKSSGNLLQGVSPINPYGIEQSLAHPTAPFTDSPVITALKKLTGG